MLVSPSVIDEANTLRLQTFVNGEIRKDSNTNDPLFDAPTIISF